MATATPTPTPTPTAAALARLFALAARGASLGGFRGALRVLQLLDLGVDLLLVLELRHRRHRRGAHAGDRALRPHGGLAAVELECRGRGQTLIGRDGHHHPEAHFEFAQVRSLLVEDVERHLGAGAQDEIVGRALEERFLDGAQDLQGHRGRGTDVARAAAMDAGKRRALQHAGADALAAHLQEAEGRDPADLDAGAVVLQALVELLLDGAVVALLLHVDEVDHDEAGKIAQAQLPGDFFRRLQIGAKRRVLDVVLAGGAARVHVDGDQRLGRVDDEVAAGFQRHVGREHRVELLLDAVAGEDRGSVAIGLHDLGLSGHQHPHEVPSLAVGVLARHQDLIQVFVVEVADGALDQRALLVDQRRCGRRQRQLAHALPQAHEVLEVALDLGLGPRGAGRTQDHAHAVRHLQVLRHFLETLAVGRGGDLARDAAAPARVGHQHRVAPGERQVGRERRAFGAALLLDDLDQDDLAALDHLLDLVVAAVGARTLGDLGERVAADLGDLGLGILALFAVLLGVVIVFRLVVLVGIVLVIRLILVGIGSFGRLLVGASGDDPGSRLGRGLDGRPAVAIGTVVGCCLGGRHLAEYGLAGVDPFLGRRGAQTGLPGIGGWDLGTHVVAGGGRADLGALHGFGHVLGAHRLGGPGALG